MKVVLFCGGLGTRLREYSETLPKPLANIGCRPIIWHLMKYYAFYGHKDFILCLGYGGELVKEFFLNYKESLSNDFVLENGGKDIHLYGKDIDDWRITFADTGLHSNLGQRLCAVRKYLEPAEPFLANYSDGLSDLPLPQYVDEFQRRDAVGSFISVRPSQSFHTVQTAPDGTVRGIEHVGGSDFWVNGGFFIFKSAIFDYINEGEELVEEPFQRLIAAKRLIARQYDGFWAAMDTFKDKTRLDGLYARGDAPWEIWKQPATGVIRTLPRHAVPVGV